MTLLTQMAIQGAVGFAIGAGTNELAIRWVFNALFTKKKRLIALNAKNLIRTELMTSEKIAAKASSPEVRAVIERDLKRRLDELNLRARSFASGLGEGLKSLLPQIALDEVKAFTEVAGVFDDDLRTTLARICADQTVRLLAADLPRLIEEADVWQIVYDTIMGYDERKMEVLTREVANRELRGVTLWGGGIGAAVGLTMSIVMWLLG